MKSMQFLVAKVYSFGISEILGIILGGLTETNISGIILGGLTETNISSP
jgi:hypothetical protein